MSVVEQLLDDLNGPQREAAQHVSGPLLILAGPGSGKTRVVTRRAAYLASTVASPRDILAITFTNKAAREMKERIDALAVGDGMTISTFHALCAKLLRIHADRAGVPAHFTIFDRDDRRKVIKQAIEACDLDAENWKPPAVERRIGFAKNALLTPDEFEQAFTDWRDETIARIYRQYEALMAKMVALDFDDLLMCMARLLDRDPALGHELEDRYPYLLIDEYQDTNAAQYKIARALSCRNQNICATGDPDQSIYGWRGASIGNILRFEKDYPQAKVIRLEQNYRSTRRILSAADRLIKGNVRRKAKTLWTENEEGPHVTVMECGDGREEAASIACDIAQRKGAGARLGDMAIFYRINALSRAVEEALFQEGIAYRVARGLEFYARREIKDVLAYLRVLVNPADEVALLRTINTPPRGIGATTVERLKERSASTRRSIYEVVTGETDLSFLGRSAGRVRDFAQLLGKLGAWLTHPVADALREVISQSGLHAHYYEEGAPDNIPLANINELISAAVVFQEAQPDATIRDWLEYTALISDVDGLDEDVDRVTLMTLHAAKGLEFPVVYIIGLEEKLLPFQRRDDEAPDEEEERRLLFVGMTRAQRSLMLTRAHYRMLRGEEKRTVRSPFLDELPEDEIEWRSNESDADPWKTRSRRNELPDDVEDWTVGSLVRNRMYGLGRIRSMMRGGRRTIVEVEFQSGACKKFALGFAELVRVDFEDVGDFA